MTDQNSLRNSRFGGDFLAARNFNSRPHLTSRDIHERLLSSLYKLTNMMILNLQGALITSKPLYNHDNSAVLKTINSKVNICQRAYFAHNGTLEPHQGDCFNTTVHIGKIVSDYDQIDKTIDILHYIDLGDTGMSFRIYNSGRSPIDKRILSPELCTDDGNHYTLPRGKKKCKYTDGYEFVSTYHVHGSISTIIASNFLLNSG